MFPIFNSAGTSPAGEAYATGSMPGEGTYFCLVCGTQLSLRETDALPELPALRRLPLPPRLDLLRRCRSTAPPPSNSRSPPSASRRPGWTRRARG